MKKLSKGVLLGVVLSAACLVGCGDKKEPGQEELTITPGTVTEMPSGTGEAVISHNGAEAEMLSKLVSEGKLWQLSGRLPKAEAVYQASEVNGQYSESVCMAAVADDGITGALFSEGLFALASDGSIVPNIAKGYSVNADATIYTILLREGLRWSDGVPFTADDCLFYYNSLCVSEVTGESIPSCFLVGPKRATFEKVNDYCFTVTFSSAKPSFLREMTEAGGVCFAPEHFYVNLLPEYMGEDAALSKAKDMGYASVKEVLRATLLCPCNFAGLPTLNAFLLSTEEGKNNVNGAYYEFVRNPYYWKVDAVGRQLPYLDRMEFTRVSGEKQRLLLTTEGYLAVSRITAEELSEAQASAERGGYHIVTWSEGSRFAVCNRLMNFPEGAPAEEKSRGIGAAHAEYWYMK